MHRPQCSDSTCGDTSQRVAAATTDYVCICARKRQPQRCQGAVVTIPKGDKVYLSYVSADRDEAMFGDTDRFDVLRPDAA